MIGMPVTVEDEIVKWLHDVGGRIASHNTLNSRPQEPYFAAGKAIKEGDPQPARELFKAHLQEAVIPENKARYERFINALSQPNAAWVAAGD